MDSGRGVRVKCVWYARLLTWHTCKMHGNACEMHVTRVHLLSCGWWVLYMNIQDMWGLSHIGRHTILPYKVLYISYKWKLTMAMNLLIILLQVALLSRGLILLLQLMCYFGKKLCRQVVYLLNYHLFFHWAFDALLITANFGILHSFTSQSTLAQHTTWWRWRVYVSCKYK